jgi:hypothetical protein
MLGFETARMKLRNLRYVSLALYVLGAQSVGAQGTETIHSLGWLAGCWELRTPTRTVEEYWMRPRGGTMLGMGAMVSFLSAANDLQLLPDA